MILGQKHLHRTATMARFRTTDVNAAAFAAMRRVLDGSTPSFLWLHGGRKSGKGYALSALHRARVAAEPAGRHLYIDAAHLVFVLAKATREGLRDALLDALVRVPTLLIDDIEAILGNAAREAFLHLVFTLRTTSRRPTVVTSTTHPVLLLNPSCIFAPMLVSVASASLSPLRRVERRAVVEQEASLYLPEIPKGVVSFIARTPGSTEEQLRRKTRRVVIAARAAAYPVTLPLAQQILAR